LESPRGIILVVAASAEATIAWKKKTRKNTIAQYAVFAILFLLISTKDWLKLFRWTYSGKPLEPKGFLSDGKNTDCLPAAACYHRGSSVVNAVETSEKGQIDFRIIYCWLVVFHITLLFQQADLHRLPGDAYEVP